MKFLFNQNAARQILIIWLFDRRENQLSEAALEFKADQTFFCVKFSKSTKWFKFRVLPQSRGKPPPPFSWEDFTVYFIMTCGHWKVSIHKVTTCCHFVLPLLMQGLSAKDICQWRIQPLLHDTLLNQRSAVRTTLARVIFFLLCSF